MIVPIDLLKPILDDLLTLGRRNRPPRPWLGLYATEVNDRIVVVGLASRGPARKAELRTGDVVLAVGGTEVTDLAGLFRRIWSLGNAGVEVPLTVYRDGRTFDLHGAFRRPPQVPEGAAAALSEIAGHRHLDDGSRLHRHRDKMPLAGEALGGIAASPRLPKTTISVVS